MGFMTALLCALAPHSAYSAEWQPTLYNEGLPSHLVAVDKNRQTFMFFEKKSPFKLRYTYPCTTGQLPGDKQALNDLRTPEGFYWIDWRKTSDKYNLSMHISYPNARDAANARKKGVSAGGMIMIHGTPDTEDYPEQWFHTLDWTDGCIAMKNHEMREVWNLVKDGTMVEIRP